LQTSGPEKGGSLISPCPTRPCSSHADPNLGCQDVRIDVILANQELNLSKRNANVAILATDKPPEHLVGQRAATIAGGQGKRQPSQAELDAARFQGSLVAETAAK
jgi:hypothetical protein